MRRYSRHELEDIAAVLLGTAQGTKVLELLLPFVEQSCQLNRDAQDACVHLISAAWSHHPETTLEILRLAQPPVTKGGRTP